MVTFSREKIPKAPKKYKNKLSILYQVYKSDSLLRFREFVLYNFLGLINHWGPCSNNTSKLPILKITRIGYKQPNGRL